MTVILVWWILSLLGVCSFNPWIALIADSIISIIVLIFSTDEATSSIGIIFPGIATFAICKQFFSLSISGWWILLSPLWFNLALIFPGGFTLTNYLLNKYSLMIIPTWVTVIGIIADILLLALIIGMIIDSRKN